MSKLDETAAALGLTPMRAIDVSQATNTSDLLHSMGQTAFTGRTLGEAADVLEQMIRDDSFIVMTLTGAMTMAGLNPLIITMLERGWVNALISTGALVGHGMVEDLGMDHYKHKPGISDDTYYENRLNRVYDVLEPEDNLDQLETMVARALDQLWQTQPGPLGTSALLKFLGQTLPGRGVLQTAVAHNVPVYIPAFTDSELGLDFAVHSERKRSQGETPLSYDAFADLADYRELCERVVGQGQKLAIFTIGGGVPRNWAQQVGPYVDVRNKRLGKRASPVRFAAGVRICPDPVHYGHLSGCTYSEGVSWGKFVPTTEGGRYAEVLIDATVGWPLLVKAMLERGL